MADRVPDLHVGGVALTGVAAAAKFSLDEIRAIEAYCQASGLTKSELIREAVLGRIRAKEIPPPASPSSKDPPAPATPLPRIPPVPPPAGAAGRVIERRKPAPASTPATKPAEAPSVTARARRPQQTYAWTCPRCRAAIVACTDELREDHYARVCTAVNREPGPRQATLAPVPPEADGGVS